MTPATTLAAAIVAALCALPASTPARAKSGAAHSGKQGSIAEAVRKSPLVFYVAKGGRDSCGHGCDAWIAAEGAFDNGAGERFRAFLKQHDAKDSLNNLPVFFSSPGGVPAAAMEIGHLMRQRGMTAGVARTIPDGCAGESPRCDALKKSRDPVAAQLLVLNTQCNSACVYALIGAKTREVAPGALLGIHSARVVVSFVGEGAHKVSAAKLREFERSRLGAINHHLRDYIEQMGVTLKLFELANTIPFEKAHYLTREEILRFGIDRRAYPETPWQLVERPSERPLLVKAMARATGDASGTFRSSMVMLTCDTGDGHSVVFGREPDGAADSAAISLVAGAQSVALAATGRTMRVGAIGSEVSYLTRTARAPAGFLSAAETGGFAIVENPKRDARAVYSSAGDDLSYWRDLLARRCKRQIAATH